MFRSVFPLPPSLCFFSPWVKQMHHFSALKKEKKNALLPLLPPIVPFPRMEVFPPIDFLPARALPNTSFLSGVISLCLPPFNCVLLMRYAVNLPNWLSRGGLVKNWYKQLRFSGINFFLRKNEVFKAVYAKKTKLHVFQNVTLLICARVCCSTCDSVRFCLEPPAECVHH